MADRVDPVLIKIEESPVGLLELLALRLLAGFYEFTIGIRQGLVAVIGRG